MRIIAGIHKGKKIYSVDGVTARPTTDFVREMIFSTLFSLEPNIETVLDLYAGSGSFGFEALSRGAESVTFVDFSRKSIATLLANFDILHCKDKCRVVQKKVDTFLNSPKGDFQSFDLIFADPPYSKGLVNQTISLIYENNLLKKEGILIIEHSKDELVAEEFTQYIIKQKVSGNTVITFMR